MKIDQQIDLPAPIERVWEFFDDVPAVAACMPGAMLSEVVDQDTFDGNVAVKVGPISVNYQGRLVIEERDAAGRTLRLNANGRDRKGAGTASARIVAILTEPEPGRTRLAVDSDVQLSGRMAAFGRGVQDVAGKLFAEFGERMSAEITRTAPATASARASAAAPAAVPAPAGQPRLVRPAAEPIKAGALLWSILRDKLATILGRLRVRR